MRVAANPSCVRDLETRSINAALELLSDKEPEAVSMHILAQLALQPVGVLKFEQTPFVSMHVLAQLALQLVKFHMS